MAYEVLMPQLGLTMEEGTVSQWIKHEGDAVKAGDVVVEITTDKLTNEITSEQDGVLLKIVAQEGEDVPVKGLLAYIGQPGEQVGETTAPAVSAASAAPSAEPAAALASAPAASPAAGGKRIRISPLARKIAGQMGVDYTVLVCLRIGDGVQRRIQAVQADGRDLVECSDTVHGRMPPLGGPSGSRYLRGNVRCWHRFRRSIFYYR